MQRLIDILTFKPRDAAPQAGVSLEDLRLRKAERDAAVLADKYPPDAADIESLSEYRLASLLQYPHY